MKNWSKPLKAHQIKPARRAFILVCLVTMFLLSLVSIAYADTANASDDTSAACVVPQVRTVLENGPLSGGEFSLALKDSAGTELEVTTNDRDGIVCFSQLSFTANELNIDSKTGEPVATTFTYLVSELPDNDSLYVYDSSVIKMSVTVTPGEDGVLQTAVVYTRVANEESPESSDDQTFVNRYVTTTIHQVVRSREEPYDPLCGAYYGLWMVNYDGEDFYLGSGRNQKKIEGSELGSADDGSIWWDIPALTDTDFYFLQELPPPTGHLMDPYPSEYFQLVHDDDESDGGYRIVFESELINTDHPSVGRDHNKTDEGESPSTEDPGIDNPANDNTAADNPTNGSSASGNNANQTQQATPVTASPAHTQKLPATSDTTCGNLALLMAVGALVWLAGCMCKSRA